MPLHVNFDKTDITQFVIIKWKHWNPALDTGAPVRVIQGVRALNCTPPQIFRENAKACGPATVRERESLTLDREILGARHLTNFRRLINSSLKSDDSRRALTNYHG